MLCGAKPWVPGRSQGSPWGPQGSWGPLGTPRVPWGKDPWGPLGDTPAPWAAPGTPPKVPEPGNRVNATNPVYRVTGKTLLKRRPLTG